MNLYLIIFLLVAAGAVWEWFRPQYGEKIYWVCWGLMTAVLCLRFGQGTDYVTYHAWYDSQPLAIDLSKGYFLGMYPEIGWRVLTGLFRGILHVPFWVFAAGLGLMDMLLLHRFLKRYAGDARILGLAMAYPVLFLVYMVSGLRQGAAACILLGLAFPFYIQRRWGWFALSVLLAAAFHRVGYAWLALMAVSYLPFSWMIALLALASVGGSLLQIEGVQTLLLEILPISNYHLNQFLLQGEISILAVGERAVSLLAIIFFYRKYTKEGHGQPAVHDLMKAYICGMCFYMLLCGNSYYASRYAAIFKILEVGLIPVLLQSRDFWRKLGFLFFLFLALLMGMKNMNAMIREGSYDTEKVSLWDFPYVSILHQERIEQYVPYGQTYTERYESNLTDQELWRLEE